MFDIFLAIMLTFFVSVYLLPSLLYDTMASGVLVWSSGESEEVKKIGSKE